MPPIRGLLATTILLAAAPAATAPRPLINYFQPMPIVGKLSTTVWGASTVGPRDPANGLEDNGSSGGVGPQQQTDYYWDGKIIKGEDGKYHLFASHWPHKDGFGPPATASGTGWETSIPMQAISDNLIGPYITQGDCYTHNQQGTAQGHNTTALVAPSGVAPYTLSVGEIVPGQMFSSPSANGPWTLLGLTNTNSNGHGGCDNLTSNFAFTVGPDHRFWATARAGCLMDSDQVLGPYKVETDSVLPNLENNDNGDAEDEAIWYSGGYFHIVYNYWNVQRAYHLMSKDGITNWTSTGLAYQASQSPTNANSNWLRYADGTVNQWHNMERVGVYQEGGHVAAFTFAVTDVDKNSSAVNTGGSKILVVPFDGVQFDCDNGDSASCAGAAGGNGGAGGFAAGGSGGRAGASGAGGLGGGAAGMSGVAGRSAPGGHPGIAGASGAEGGAAGGPGGAMAGGGAAGTFTAGAGGRQGGPGGAAGGASGSGGCACDVGLASSSSLRSTLLLLTILTSALRRQPVQRSRRRLRSVGCDVAWPRFESPAA